MAGKLYVFFFLSFQSCCYVCARALLVLLVNSIQYISIQSGERFCPARLQIVFAPKISYHKITILLCFTDRPLIYNTRKIIPLYLIFAEEQELCLSILLSNYTFLYFVKIGFINARLSLMGIKHHFQKQQIFNA